MYQLCNPAWLGLQIRNTYLYPSVIMCCWGASDSLFEVLSSSTAYL